MAVVTNENFTGSVPSQIDGQVLMPSYKWFSLQDNNLGGSCHPIDSSGILHIGWWGNTLSDVNGSFSTACIATITFSAREIHTLSVCGDSLLNEFPVDFNVKMYSGATLLQDITIIGNTQIQWKQLFSELYIADKIVLNITKVNKAYRTVKIVQGANVYEIARVDNLVSKMDASVLLSLGVYSLDTLQVIIGDEQKQMVAEVSSVDSIIATLLDNSFFTQYEIWKSDALLIKTIDNKQLENSFNKNDNLRIYFSELKNITASLKCLDSLIIAKDLEANIINAELSSVDIIPITLLEQEFMTNIHTIMADPERQVLCKVEITYTDPDSDSDTTITVLGTANGSTLDSLTDSVEESKYAWFGLNNNKLDGSLHVMDSKQLYPTGWWGSTLADINGSFSPSEIVTIDFSARLLDTLKVVGDDKLYEFPVNFDIKLYSNDILVYTEVVSNNAQVNWSKLIEPVDNITKLVLVVYSINKGNRNLKLTELFTAVKETYTSEELVYVDVLEELTYITDLPTLGIISSNEIDLALDNSTSKFSFGNIQSKLNNKLKRYRPVKVWFGAEVVPNEIEWYEYGKYWTTDWKVPSGSLVAYTTALDRLNVLQNTEFSTSQVYTDISIYNLFEMVLIDAGLNADEYYISDKFASIIVPLAWFLRMSHREALHKIAGCVMVNIYCDRLGKIIIDDTVPTENIMLEYRDDLNIFEKDFPLAWSELANYLEVSAKEMILDAQAIVVNVTVPIDIAVNETKILIYDFNSTPCVNVLDPVMQASAGVVIDSYSSYCWGISITVSNTSGINGTINSIQVTGTPYKEGVSNRVIIKDDKAIRADGMVKVNIQHDFIQTIEQAQSIATTLVSAYKSAKQDIVIEGRGDIAIKLGDRATVETYDTFNEYMITRRQVKWDGSLSVKTYGKKI